MSNPVSATVTELSKYAKFIIDKVCKSKKPIIIKYFGQPKIVLLDLDSYNKLIQKEENNKKEFKEGKYILVNEEEYNELKNSNKFTPTKNMFEKQETGLNQWQKI